MTSAMTRTSTMEGSVSPSGTDTAADWKARGNAAFSTKRFTEAVRCFTEAIKLNPRDHILYSNRSGAYASLERYEDALDDSDRCISLKPDWPKGYSRKGLAEFHLGRVKAAIVTFKKGLDLDPANASLKEGLAQAEAADPDRIMLQHIPMIVNRCLQKPKFKAYADADSEFTPKLTAILQEILKDAEQLKIFLSICPDHRIREAVQFILRVPGGEDEDDNDDDFDRQSNGSKTCEKQSKSEEPAPAPTVELTFEQKEAVVWKEKGNALYKQRKFEEALEAYDQAIKLHPKEMLYYINRTAVLLEMGDFERCISECQSLIERRHELDSSFSKVAKVYNRMAACYSRQGDLTSSIQMYEKSLVEENNRHTRAALAETVRRQQKKEREAYINPDIAEQHREKGNEFFKQNDFPAAKKEYDEAILRNPTDARLWANRAAAYMKLLEYPLALQDVEKSLQLDPSVPKVWARKGVIYTRMKEFHKAVTAFQKGLDIDPNNSDCMEGYKDVMIKIQQSTVSDKIDEEQVQHSMADPEIQGLLTDPQFRLVLNNISQDPKRLLEAMQDPSVAAGIRKLMAAGLLKFT